MSKTMWIILIVIAVIIIGVIFYQKKKKADELASQQQQVETPGAGIKDTIIAVIPGLLDAYLANKAKKELAKPADKKIAVF